MKAIDVARVFGVVDIGDFYCLRHVLFIEDLDESEVVNSIRWLGGQADILESEVGGDAL
jgi:hypothetical protein